MSALEDSVRTVLRDFKFKGNRGYAKRLKQIVNGSSGTSVVRKQSNKPSTSSTSSSDDQTPSDALIYATTFNDLYQVKKAIKNGGDIRYLCPGCKQTALIIATKNGYFRIIDYLLQIGSDIWQEDDHWRSAWYFAFFGSGLSITKSNLPVIERFWEQEKVKDEAPSAHIMLMAAYASSTEGLAPAVLEKIPFTILSRDSNHLAKVRFVGLENLDDPTVNLTWPDGSKTDIGETALHVLTKKKQAKVLVHPACIALLHWKWMHFGRFMFIIELGLFLGYLVLLTGVSLLSRPGFGTSSEFFAWLEQQQNTSSPIYGGDFDAMGDLSNYNSDFGILRLILEIQTILLNQFLLLTIVTDSGYMPTPVIRALCCLGNRFVTRPTKSKSKLIQTLPHVLLNLLVIMRVCNASHRSQVDVLAIASVLSWLRLISYFQMLESIGPFFIMLTEMLLRDVLPFGAVVGVVVPAFAIGISLSVSNTYDIDYYSRTNFGSFEMLMVNLLQTFAGTNAFATFLSDRVAGDIVDWVSLFLYLGFLVVVPVLCLNLLIAIMSNRYSQINEHSVAEWSLRRAQYLIQRETYVHTAHFGFRPTHAPKIWWSRETNKKKTRKTAPGDVKAEAYLKNGKEESVKGLKHVDTKNESFFFRKQAKKGDEGYTFWVNINELLDPYNNIRTESSDHNFTSLLLLLCCKVEELQTGMHIVERGLLNERTENVVRERRRSSMQGGEIKVSPAERRSSITSLLMNPANAVAGSRNDSDEGHEDMLAELERLVIEDEDEDEDEADN